MDYSICPACGEENPAQTPYCSKCGTSLRNAQVEPGVQGDRGQLQSTLVDELRSSRLSNIRIHAANQLGALSESSEQVVTALMVAQASDEDPGVRAAAARALQAPANLAIKSQVPGLAAQAAAQIPD